MKKRVMSTTRIFNLEIIIQYNRIIPTVLNQKPQYIFVNENEGLNSYTLPINPLYKPIVLSEDRYSQLRNYKNAKIKIDVRCSITGLITKGVNPYTDMSRSEKELYVAKVPIQEGSFDYPVNSIKVSYYSLRKVLHREPIEWELQSYRHYQVRVPIEWREYYTYDLTEENSKLLTQDQYEIKDGNIYFYEPLEDLVTPVMSSGSAYYTVTINFNKLVKESDTNSINGITYDQLALYQATQYAIMDYFAQATFAERMSYVMAEVAHTTRVTIESTFWTTIISTGMNIGTEGLISFVKGGTGALVNSLLTNIIKFPISLIKEPVEEVIEEIFLDEYIESWAEGYATSKGWDQNAIFWFQNILTSLRETLMGPLGRLAIKGGAWISSKLKIDVWSDYRSWYSNAKAESGLSNSEFRAKFAEEIRNQYNEAARLASEQSARGGKVINFLKSNALRGFLMAIPSFLFGDLFSGSVVTLTGILGDVDEYVGEKFNNYLKNKIADYYRRKNMANVFGLEPTSPIVRGLIKIKTFLFGDPIQRALFKRAHENNPSIAVTPFINPDPRNDRIPFKNLFVEYDPLQDIDTYEPPTYSDWRSNLGPSREQQFQLLKDLVKEIKTKVQNVKHLSLEERYLSKEEGTTIKLSIEGDSLPLASEASTIDPDYEFLGEKTSFEFKPSWTKKVFEQEIRKQILDKYGKKLREEYGLNRKNLEIKVVYGGFSNQYEDKKWDDNTNIINILKEIYWEETGQPLYTDSDEMIKQQLEDYFTSERPFRIYWVNREYSSDLDTDIEFHLVTKDALISCDFRSGYNLQYAIENFNDFENMEKVFTEAWDKPIKAFKTKFKELIGSGVDSVAKRTWLKKKLKTMTEETYLGKIDQIMDTLGLSDAEKKEFHEQYEDEYNEMLQDIIQTKFNEVLDKTSNNLINFYLERVLKIVTYEHLMRNEFGFHNLKTENEIEISQTVQETFAEYANDKKKLEELSTEMREWLCSEGIEVLIRTLTEAFNPLSFVGGMKLDIMSTTFHGWKGESDYFFNLELNPTDLFAEFWAVKGYLYAKYQFVEFNPGQFDRKLNEHFREVLGKDSYSALLEFLNNEIDMVKKFKEFPKNGREFDGFVKYLAQKLPDGTTQIKKSISTHIKSYRSSTNEKMKRSVERIVENLPVDVIGTLLPEFLFHFSRTMSLKNVLGPEHISFLVSPITDSSMIYEMFKNYVKITKIKDIKNIKGISKGKLHMELMERIVDFINGKNLFNGLLSEGQCEDKLDEFFNTNEAYFKIKEFALEIYSKEKGLVEDITKFAQLLENWDQEYEEIMDTFTMDAGKLLRELPNNKFILIWQEVIVHYFKSDIKARTILFPAEFKIYDSATSTLKTINEIGDREISSVMVHMYNKRTGERGMISAMYLEDLPTDWCLGFYDSDKQLILPDIFITDEEGYLLNGLISLDFENKQFKIEKENWFEKYLHSNIIETTRGDMLINHYRSMVKITGEKLIPFFQRDILNTRFIEKYQGIFPYNLYKESKINKGYNEGVIIKEEKEIDKNDWIINQMDTLFFKLYKLIGIKSLSEKIQELAFRDDLFNLLEDKIKYTYNGYQEIFNTLIGNFGSDSNKFEEINRYATKEYKDGILIDIKRNPSFAGNLGFFKTWFQIIKKDIEIRGENSYFRNFPREYVGLSFDNEEDIPELFEAVKEQLLDLLGYPTLMLLYLGIMHISKLNGQFIFNFWGVGQSFNNNWEVETSKHKKISLGSMLFESKVIPNGKRGEHPFSYGSKNKKTLYNAFISLFTQGFEISFELNNHEEPLLLEINPNKIGITRFIDELTNLYNPKTSTDYYKVTIFIYNRYWNFVNEIEGPDKIVNGKRLLMEKIFPLVEKAVTDKLKRSWPNQFENGNPKDWVRRTVEMALYTFGYYIDRPSKTETREGRSNLNFIEILRYALYSGTNALLQLKGATRGGTGPLSTIRPNDFFHSDFQVEVPFEILRSIEKDIIYALTFTPHSDYSSENNEHQPGYILDYLEHLNEERKGRFKDAYIFFYKLFKQHKDDGPFTITFSAETGAGINIARGLISSKFYEYGITESQIKFDPKNENELHEAIQTMLFYTSFNPRIMAIVQQGELTNIDKMTPHFLTFGRGKLYDTSYLLSSSQRERDRFNCPSWWGEKEGEFQMIMREFNGYDNHLGVFRETDFVDITVFTNRGTDIGRARFMFEHFAEFLRFSKFVLNSSNI
ncbi:MAG: hypothetical protein P8Y70_00330 [Candidatus Lokiarchaeota archaeon]